MCMFIKSLAWISAAIQSLVFHAREPLGAPNLHPVGSHAHLLTAQLRSQARATDESCDRNCIRRKGSAKSRITIRWSNPHWDVSQRVNEYMYIGDIIFGMFVRPSITMPIHDALISRPYVFI